MNTLTLRFDGACDNNSKFKFMGIGIAVWENGERQPQLDHKEMIGTNGTSNIAEWHALTEALSICHAYVNTLERDTKIRIHGDSQLIVNQFAGKWKIKEENFLPYKDKCSMYKKLLGSRLKVVSWIPRGENTEADRLSKEAILDYINSLE